MTNEPSNYDYAMSALNRGTLDHNETAIVSALLAIADAIKETKGSNYIYHKPAVN
jgi:hypothetical protein